MYVIKRNGQQEPIQFDKITKRLQNMCTKIEPVLAEVEPVLVAQRVIQGVFNGVKTSELDQLAAETAAYMSTINPEYGDLAARIAVSNLQKQLPNTFSENVKVLFEYVNPKTGKHGPLVSKELYDIVTTSPEKYDCLIDSTRDFLFDYFGFKTLEKSYFAKINGRVHETPQYLFMRVAIGIHGEDYQGVMETYTYMSQKYFIHATPTLFNAGTIRPQMSSCFLLQMKDDSIEGIYDTLKQTAMISKTAGGIGLSIHNVRAASSYIAGTNGVGNGIVPMLRVFNDTARYVDQCFTPETIIFTDKGPKCIENVTTFDSVITSDGQMNKVNRLVQHPDEERELLEITIRNCIYPVRVTPEHELLVLKNQKRGLAGGYETIKKRIDTGLSVVESVTAKDVTRDDMLVFPIPTYENDIDEISEEDCRMYGILVGDGHLDKNTGNAYLNKTSKVQTVAFVEKYLSDRKIDFRSEMLVTNCFKISWSLKSFVFKRTNFYDDQKNKIIESKMLHLSIPKIKQILKGLIETDGHLGNEILLEMSSFQVIESVRYIMMRLGILTSGYTRNRIGNVSSYKNITTRQETMVIRIPKTKDIVELFPSLRKSEKIAHMRHGNFMFSRVETITNFTRKCHVYDFEINNVHDYTVSHLGNAFNGGGKRKGSFAIYLEPHHPDIFEFLELKKNTGKDENRARDLFYAMWLSDLFMNRVEADQQWSLFCPNEAPGLHEVYGDDYRILYEKYEKEGRARKVVKARDLWAKIIESQIETGTPYMLYKDACNRKSNQQNLGTIKSSNLCTEIVQYTSPDEVAVCNLASLALPQYISTDDQGFDHDKLFEIVQIVTKNLNKVIDINWYPIEEARTSNLKHRPIGIGVQGLADVFLMLRMPFESPEAKQLNIDIFETLYYAALWASIDLAKKDGPYQSYHGSPASKGILQFDLWTSRMTEYKQKNSRWNWTDLKARMAKYGLRNSLLVAPMPTASTSQILGNNEAFEPFTSNIYSRRVLAGDYTVLNRHLYNDLKDVWSTELKNKIIANGGSVQGIPEIPKDIQELYKTVWEIKQKVVIDMAADRGKYICQSQSLNIHLAEPTFSQMNSMHFYSWKKGLKTGMYYLRTRPATNATQFTIAVSGSAESKEVCTMKEGCVTCSS